MKTLFIASLLLISNFAMAIDSWECSTSPDATKRVASLRLEKDSDGSYSAFLTAGSGDLGTQWSLNDTKVGDHLNCQFSKTTSAAYCIFQTQDMSQWTEIGAANHQVTTVDENGADQALSYTEVRISGNSDVLMKLPSNSIQLNAINCSSK